MVSAASLKKSVQWVILFTLVYAMIANWGLMREKTSSLVQGLSNLRQTGLGSPLGTVQGDAVLLMDEKTGKILYGKNPHTRMYPASTTKILTALIALEKGNPDKIVTVGDEAGLGNSDESTAGLYEGEQLTLRDLLSALLLPSGNDAARTIARHISSIELGREVSSEEANEYFSGLMNKRAKALGANESHFVNPHGLHDPGHYTTAYDMAVIAKEARKNKLFKQIVNESERTLVRDEQSQSFVNRNKLIQKQDENYYAGATGIKTGFTEKAGYCLVASASRQTTSLIAVVLHSTKTTVWLDARTLLDYGFTLNKTDPVPRPEKAM
ncbi:D-alanyl-D-alanine carboxypeptidase family protein [Paenibacillus nasutitermitis]|nr:D-alanyl-D-alanine carboxypeptidase family protein [Paenibacillus nasutitermitis]